MAARSYEEQPGSRAGAEIDHAHHFDLYARIDVVVVDEVSPKGESISYSWSGPLDGSMQPLRDPTGQVLLQESLIEDKDGALLRRGVDSKAGWSFEAHATLSADGNTITDVVSVKTKDGKAFKVTMVLQRVAAGK